MWHRWIGWKMPLCKWNTFWINLLFYCHVILQWEKATSCERFIHSLTLEAQFAWKISAFQCYWWNYRNPEKQLNFKKLYLKWKIWKTFYEAQTMSRLKEINQTNTRYKSPTSLKQKFSYRDVQEYTDICFPSASRMQFLSFQKWCSANVFFLSSTRNMCPGKFVKQLRFLAVLRE